MLNQDYREMLLLFIENNVEFLLVGAYAMAAHGYPRATADIDIFVNPNPSNAARVFKALSKFGAAMKDVTIQDFETPGTIFQIGVEPRRIDIITEIDGLTFEEASEGLDIIDIEGLAIPLISKDKLIMNKLATGRDKDRRDAERLQGKKEK